MARKSTKKEVANESISLQQFKSWLQGVEDMQPDNWAPNKEQWARIREKIDLIEQGDPVAPTRPAVVQTNYGTQGTPRFPGPAVMPQAPSALPVQPYQGDLPPARNLPDPLKIPGGKTPDIDSSNGYDSMFA